MRVNKNRIAVVIGKNGEIKKTIEDSLGVKIDISSKNGEISLIPDINHENYDSLNVLVAKKVISAINRGFNPNKAMKLMEENIDLDVFNLAKILGKSEKKIKRIKGRVIGKKGEMRKAIEKYTESFLSVYGKTIALIGNYENLQISRKAVSMLINGMPHHTVLKFLENKYSEKKKEEFRKFYKPEF